MRLPERVSADGYRRLPSNTGTAMSPAERDIVLKADPKTAVQSPGRRAHCTGVSTTASIRTGGACRWRRVAVQHRGAVRPAWLYTDRGPGAGVPTVEQNRDADYPLKPPVGRSGVPSRRQSYSIAAVNEFDPYFDDIYQFCEDQDIEIDTSSTRTVRRWNQPDPRAAAGSGRSGFLFKAPRARRRCAKMYATFMAKPCRRSPAAPCTSTRWGGHQDAQEHLQQPGRHALAAVLSTSAACRSTAGGARAAVR